MIRSLFGVLLALVAFFSLAEAQAKGLISEISCMELRDEPGAPTIGFELKQVDGHFVAKFLSYVANPSTPPIVRVKIDGLNCDFDSKNALIFDCGRLGVGINGVQVQETSMVDGLMKNVLFFEMRAVGSDVPDIVQTYRAMNWRDCKIK